jgi:carbonic anhydrase
LSYHPTKRNLYLLDNLTLFLTTNPEPTDHARVSKVIKAKPLPQFLVKRYQGWKATDYEENKSWYARLADEGQRPRAMIISCCDSRVHITSIFGAVSGDFFIHRNIASLVPPYGPDEAHHGTSAAIEYAVNHLKVSHILIVGHSLCGGVRGCYDMCSGNAPELDAPTSFIGRWMDILRPGYDAIKDHGGSEAERVEALEKESVKLSLQNLMSFPFIAEAIEAGSLDLHGLWNNIKTGELENFDPETGDFRLV